MDDFLKQFLAYNDEANRRFIDAIRQSKPSSERIGPVFSHVLNAHRIWNARIDGVSPPSGVWDIQTAESWNDLNRENFERSIEIAEAGSLDRVIEYRNSKGNPYRSSTRDILIHVVNHSSYHRGQLAILLGQDGRTPPVTDYIAYVRESESHL